jgi:hypothetical protein
MFIPSRFFIPTMWIATALLVLAAVAKKAQAGPNEAPAELSSRVTHFAGIDLSKTPLPALEQELGNQGKTKEQPWSGSYWALYNGSVAWPYMMEGTNLKHFHSNKSVFEERLPPLRAAAMSGKLDAAVLDQLSPTEKYDLYLGDTDFSLTHSVWQAIQEQSDFRKGIQEWEGICHGWSTASAYVKRPSHKVVVPSLNGKFLIPFYPDDLKALVTLLWANSLIQDYTKTEGLRCHTDSPEFDEGNGKVLDNTCKGVNPALWHLSVLSLVGKQHKPFIINKNNNKEIWNQPVSEYEIRYFNPKRGQYGSLEESTVSTQRAWDGLSQFRGQSTHFLVGVEMKLSYVAETNPDHLETDSKEIDRIETMILRYDLELDEQKRVVGGEWLYSDHADFGLDEFKPPVYPGFIWRFQSENPIAMSVADAQVPLAGIQTMPDSERVALSRKAASFRYDLYERGPEKPVVYRRELRPQPLGAVVYPLIEWAHR